MRRRALAARADEFSAKIILEFTVFMKSDGKVVIKTTAMGGNGFVIQRLSVRMHGRVGEIIIV